MSSYIAHVYTLFDHRLPVVAESMRLDEGDDIAKEKVDANMNAGRKWIHKGHDANHGVASSNLPSSFHNSVPCLLSSGLARSPTSPHRKQIP